MPDSAPEDRFRFLYRQGEGVVDRTTWARASLLPMGIALVLTAVAFWIAPDKPRDLGSEAFINPLIVLRQAYLIAYAFALLICLVAEYFLCAKRFRDRGRPGALAGIAPFALLIAGAANWYQPLSEGVMSPAALIAVDVVALAAIVWTVAELGFGIGRRLTRGS
jgi:uncharacterized membrane protein YhaH (DUF805 family)